MGTKHTHRFPRLNQKRLISFKRLEAPNDRIESLPTPCSLSGAAIHD